MSDVFISHVEEDRALALALSEGLEAARFTTWCYERHSVPGPSYLRQTGQAIEECRAFLILLSHASLDSDQIDREVVRAFETRKHFIPVLSGVEHREFQTRRPEWRQAIGSAVSIPVPPEGLHGVLPRIIGGLRMLGIEPGLTEGVQGPIPVQLPTPPRAPGPPAPAAPVEDPDIWGRAPLDTARAGDTLQRVDPEPPPGGRPRRPRRRAAVERTDPSKPTARPSIPSPAAEARPALATPIDDQRISAPASPAAAPAGNVPRTELAPTGSADRVTPGAPTGPPAVPLSAPEAIPLSEPPVGDAGISRRTSGERTRVSPLPVIPWWRGARNMGLGAIAVLALFGFAVYLQRAASGPDAPIQPPSPTTTAPQPAVSPPAVSPTQPSGTAGTAVTSGAEMVAVSAGPFWMGSDDGEDNEKPRRRVTLDGFSIDKFEVTNALYQKFVKATGRAAPGHWTASELNGPQQPVVGVSWDDAVAYCAWAGKRLPTEAEWEKAARGTDGSKYPWGDKWDASRANSSESRLGATAKVGSYPSGASPYRAHDMAGNAWEWVADWYDEEYYKKGPDRNPKGPDTGFTRVLRGGSWDLSPVNLRAAYRYDNPPDYRFNRIGFRCARGLSP